MPESEMPEFQCPCCRAYTADSRKAVGAHISSKVDADHKGEFGAAWEDEILPVSTDGGTQSVDSAALSLPATTETDSTRSTDSTGMVGVPAWVVVLVAVALASWVVLGRSGQNRQQVSEEGSE